MTIAMRLLIVCGATLVTIGSGPSSIQNRTVSALRNGLYAVNPDHLWNRIHQLFHVRYAADGSGYGFDTVDPLLWRETKHLLRRPFAASAVRILDEFLASNGQRPIRDPLKRAVFQHDLWAVFDWLASVSEGDKAARSALMQRLARVIQRVALSRKNIEALHATYAARIASGRLAGSPASSPPEPYLPRDLFSPSGPWVSVGGHQPLAPQHAAELGRSAFTVLWNLPGGKAPGPFMLRHELDGCINCHHVGVEPATATILSLRQMLKPGSLVDSRHDRWARWFTPGVVAAEANGRSYEWGVLQGLWQSEPR
jgi:hypothetical protein